MSKSREIINRLSKLTESVLDLPHSRLNPAIWQEDKKMIKEVKAQIEGIINIWIAEVYPEAKIQGLYMIGSNTGFQYTNTSDVDVNCIIDKIPEEKIKELTKILPNGNLVAGTEHPINFYISTDAKQNLDAADSIYNIANDEWVKEPQQQTVSIPYSYVIDVARVFIDGITSRIREYQIDKKDLEVYTKYLSEEDLQVDKEEIKEAINRKNQEIRADLDAIFIGHKVLKGLRKEAFADAKAGGVEDVNLDFLIDIKSSSANLSIANLCYKVIESYNILDEIAEYEKIRKEMIEKDEHK